MNEIEKISENKHVPIEKLSIEEIIDNNISRLLTPILIPKIKNMKKQRIIEKSTK